MSSRERERRRSPRRERERRHRSVSPPRGGRNRSPRRNRDDEYVILRRYFNPLPFSLVRIVACFRVELLSRFCVLFCPDSRYDRRSRGYEGRRRGGEDNRGGGRGRSPNRWIPTPRPHLHHPRSRRVCRRSFPKFERRYFELFKLKKLHMNSYYYL
jgi:hypothetical protein